MAINACDVNAEQALLGVAMYEREDALAAFLTVPLEAYWSERHRVIASLMREMAARQRPIDPQTVGSALEDAGDLHKIGGLGYIHTLFSALAAPRNASYYAERINELYGRRLLSETCQRELQRLDADWSSGLTTDVQAAATRLTHGMDEAKKWAIGTVQQEPMNLEELLERQETHDWLVPGLLERGDRTVFTGDEGLGKSELVGQIAITLAAGMHPFTSGELDPEQEGMRVLVVDCENSESQLRRRYRRIVGIVNALRERRNLPEVPWKKHLMVDFRTEGMDLLSSHDAAYLESLVSRAAPDLLVIGPLYKLHAADINDEHAARELVYVLDQIRVRHRCALITEAHAGHGKDGQGGRMMRPRGSSLFVGWPEFGFGLRGKRDDPEAADVVGWRGQREERDWPLSLHRGTGLSLPWVPGEEYRRFDNWAGQYAQ